MRNLAWKDGPLNMSRTLPQTYRSGSVTVSSQLIRFVLVLAALLLAAFLLACIPAFGQEAAEWLGYNRTLDSHRLSPLTGITVENVGDFKGTCDVVFGDYGASSLGRWSSDAPLYVTKGHTTVPFDVATGRGCGPSQS
jgi:glucose dehydrogenase